MKVDELLEDLSDILEDAKELPVVNKIMVDKTQISDIIDEIRANLPAETRQAKRVVADRNKIIEEARKQAETLISAANQQRTAMLENSEIVIQARQEAQRIIDEAQSRSQKMRAATNAYIDDTLLKTEELLKRSAVEFHQKRLEITSAKNAPKRPAATEPVAAPTPPPQPNSNAAANEE